MEEKLNGILIKSVNYGENDKILTIFTLENGVISAKIKGVKKAGAKLKFASEPFCFSEYIIIGKDAKKTVINASMNESFYPLRTDIKKFYLANVIIEFVRLFCLPNSVYGELFLSVINSLKDLAYSDKDEKVIVIKFLLEGLLYIGYQLNINNCNKCNCEIKDKVFFDFDEGCVYCENCHNETSVQINFKTYEVLKRTQNNQTQIEDEKYLIRALKLIAHYITNKTGETIKSLEEFFDLK